MQQLDQLLQNLMLLLENKIITYTIKNAELTIVVPSEDIKQILYKLRVSESTYFEQCMDLCGVDYSTYKNNYSSNRFALVYHLLSIKHRHRLRVKTFLTNDDLPMIDSAVEVYNSLNWYEREAFDMFGIIFNEHPDLRRILTDYGFIGHPFRKDFPLSGFVEMTYDEEQKRVIYQGVSIEPRENTLRVIREEQYCGRD